MKTKVTEQLGIEYPIICGPMYPCSNPELIAAVSEAGGMGVIQPIAMVYVYKKDLREGIRWIKSQTDKPIGMNVLIEKTVKAYEERMRNWVDIALEEGVRFFITSLGNPRWVVEKVHAVGGIVYHDVISRKFAEKALDANVDGIICVNQRAGGHAGSKSKESLYDDLWDLGKPLVLAGGVGNQQDFIEAIELGYQAVQMGTRFIATDECEVPQDYKQAIVDASEEDIVLTDKISGTPCAVIKTPYLEKTGLKATGWEKKLLKGRKTKYLMRTFYGVRSLLKLKKTVKKGLSYKDFWQAGKSVSGIHSIEPAGEIVTTFAEALKEQQSAIQSS